MKNFRITALVFALIALVSMAFIPNSKTIYDFKLPALDGQGEVNFADFKGKKILIVNTASKCGYTHQYEDIEAFYRKHKDKVVVVACPANNFGFQEPGSNSEIKQFCSAKFDVTFPMTEKISVRGKEMHPLYQWLTNEANAELTGNVSWNFEKFLIDENGHLEHRFKSRVNVTDEEFLDKIK